jgi:hypothetical protein
MKYKLEPGAEYSPWGDMVWELYGLPDGTLPDDPFPANDERLRTPYWQKSDIFSSHLFFLR